jgi:hypothetical protein
MPTPSQLDASGDAIRQVIRAYHGSPYDFNKFDASKIGTGEGLQAYGHGLYFAGDEGVAQHYRDILSADEEIPLPWPLSDEYAQVYQDFLTTSTKEGEWRRLNPGRLLEDNPFQSQLEKASAAFSDVRRRADEATKVPGKVYEVEIAHPEEALLNWDRPTAPAGGVGAKAAEVLRAVSPRDIDQSSLDFIRRVRPGEYAKPAYGTDIDRVERALQKLAQDPAGAAELRDAGIPGLKYLDGVSRSAGSGSRNYVMFPGTEDQIRILRKYGLMAPLAAGAASGQTAPGQNN